MKISSILIFVLFSLFANSEDLVVECKELKRLLDKSFSEFKFNEPDSDTIERVYFVIDKSSYGIDSNIKYKRSKSNRLYIDTTSPMTFKDNNLNYGDEIYAINNLLVSERTDDEINNMIDLLNTNKEDLILTIIDKDQNLIEFNARFTAESAYYIPTNFNLLSVDKIDSSSSTYKSRFKTNITYSLLGLDKIAKELIEINGTEPNEIYINQCNYTEKEFDLLNLWKPELINPNVVSIEGDSTKVTYTILYAKFLEDDDSPYYDAEIIQTIDSIATFKGQFNYKSFPFDKQTLIYKFESAEGGQYALPYWDYDAKLSNNIELYEWTVKDYQIKSYVSNNQFEQNVIGISYEIDIERNYIYFITKIYLPIIIILLMSFSVLWIKPSSLDSRLQVGVVCFLALITFTFIVDQELPKLSYLTIMDLVILISYVFAAMTTIESIYIAKYVDDYKTAEKIDSTAKKLLPTIYLLLILLIIFSSIYSNNNTIEALRLTT